MEKCFVMQPFDRGAYDKRYDDVFAPAIEDAHLEPYRVDRDPGVSIPIDEIEGGIRRSIICLADITEDNPNVWFELGYAIAVSKDVIMVCSDKRVSRFPFDIQHRNIVRYKTESQQDFIELRGKITERIHAILNKQEKIGAVSRISPVAETMGLTQHEMVALVTVMENNFHSPEGVPVYTIKGDMNKAGFTDIAVGLALKLLRDKEMLSFATESDFNGNQYVTCTITPRGEEWLVNNQDKLVLRSDLNSEIYTTNEDDDLPF